MSRLPDPLAVLVVEDEPLLLMDAVDFLEDAGFGVYQATNARDAVSVLEARADIGVLFTDIDMPGTMDGLALAKAVRDRWPPMHVIVTSGHKRPVEADMPIRSIFVPKPYQYERVVAQIRRMAA